jgi:hypothetical protein
VIEERRELGVQLRPPQLERRCLRRRAEHRDDRVLELEASGCLRRRDDSTLDLDDRLREHRRGRRAARVVVDDDLGDAGRVAQQQERDLREVPLVVHPACEPDVFAGVLGELARHDPFHRLHLCARPDPWSCGREGVPRGATALHRAFTGGLVRFAQLGVVSPSSL